MLRILLLLTFCNLTCFEFTASSQNGLLHRFINETNQSFNNGIVSDGEFLYGTKWDGGQYGKGYVYRVGIVNSEFDVLHSFDGDDSGAGGLGTLVLNEGVLYGITNMGGAENMGTLFKLNTDGSGYVKLYDFDHLTSTPFQSRAIDGNTLYGTTRDDYNARGRIFSINTDGEDFQIIFSFNGENGREPSSPLTVRDGFLYGTTLGGGFNDNGVLFKIRTNGDDFTILKDDFDAELSFMPTGSLVVLDNTIYGAALQGGSYGCGLIYKVNTDGSMYEELADFGVLTGCNPNGLTHYESALYGMTSIGGNADGVIFKVDLVDHSFTLLHKFNKFDGANPDAALTVINDQLFGYANNGEFNYGVVFSIDPDGNNFTIVKHLEGTNIGYYPEGSVVVTPSLCYGFTRGGGLYNSGVIYSIDPDGQNYQVLHSFFPQDGAIPTGSMILCDDMLYGLTQQGGRDGQGTFFSYALGDNSYSKLFDFNYQKGNYPNGSLVELGSKLYGVASSGGMANRGVFFEINKDGTGFKPVIDFAETDAVRPVGSLIELNSVFYGLASSYATDYLVLYSSNADGSDFKIIYESDGVDAGRYGAALATDSTYIYAVSHQGGLGDFGVLFRFKIDGTEFSKLHDFSLSLGAFPVAPLVLDNGTLFISTSTGGVSGLGSVIGISTDGADIFEIVDYVKLELFDGLKKTKISQTERLKSSSNESTIGAISVRNKNI